MPHVPDRHADHDVELVAASISDDLTAAKHATVSALLAACGACRELAADLRALAAATAGLPVPPRRRDYRLTPDQAARLRRSGVRGVLAALGSRRFSFAAPLGTAMATLGIVGLLVAAIPGPLAGGAAQAPMRTAAEREDTPVLAMPDVNTMSLPSAGPMPDTGAPPAGSMAPRGGPDIASGPEAFVVDEPPSGGLFTTMVAEISNARGLDGVLVILGGTGILAGLALVAMRWLGRQLA